MIAKDDHIGKGRRGKRDEDRTASVISTHVKRYKRTQMNIVINMTKIFKCSLKYFKNCPHLPAESIKLP